MRRQTGLVLLFVLAGGLLAAGPALGQGTTLEMTSGGSPLAGIPVSSLVNGIKKPLGTTNSAGEIDVTPEQVGLASGTEVQIAVRDCVEGETEVVLAGPGESGGCEDGEGCDCERPGAFVLGQTSRVALDIGTSGVAMETTSGGGSAPPGLGNRGVLAFIADFFVLTEFEDVVGDQDGIVTNDADGSAYGFSGQLEVRPFETSNFFLGGGFSYARTSYDQTYANGGPNQVEGDMDIWAGEGYAGWGWPLGSAWRTRVAVFGGTAVVYNVLDLQFEDLNGDPGDEERSETGLRGLGGVVLDHWFGDNLGVRLRGTYLSGGSNDADSRFGLGGGLSIPVF